MGILDNKFRKVSLEVPGIVISDLINCFWFIWLLFHLWGGGENSPTTFSCIRDSVQVGRYSWVCGQLAFTSWIKNIGNGKRCDCTSPECQSALESCWYFWDKLPTQKFRPINTIHYLPVHYIPVLWIKKQVTLLLSVGPVFSMQFLQQHTTWVPYAAVGSVLHWSHRNPGLHLRHEPGQEGSPKSSC